MREFAFYVFRAIMIIYFIIARYDLQDGLSLLKNQVNFLPNILIRY